MASTKLCRVANFRLAITFAHIVRRGCSQSEFQVTSFFSCSEQCQEPLNRGVSNGGVSRSGLVLAFLSFFVLLGLSRGFSRFARGWSGDFPDSFLFSFSAY